MRQELVLQRVSLPSQGVAAGPCAARARVLEGFVCTWLGVGVGNETSGKENELDLGFYGCRLLQLTSAAGPIYIS